MVCTLEELRSKDVINVVNGENLGRIDDLQMNAQTASVTALILYGRPRLWGIFGPRDNCIIDFRQIRLGRKRRYPGGTGQDMYRLHKYQVKLTQNFCMEKLDRTTRFLV